jgi:hypothetical protein
MSQEKAISDDPFPKVRKAARGNQFEAIHGGATRPSRRLGEMLGRGKKRVNVHVYEGATCE